MTPYHDNQEKHVLRAEYEAALYQPSEQLGRQRRLARRLAQTAEIIVGLPLDIVRERRGEQPCYSAHPLDRVWDSDEVYHNRILATATFVRLGKIAAADVNSEGLLRHDPLYLLSTYFSAYHNTTGRLEAVDKLIWAPDATIADYRMPLEQIDSRWGQFLTDQPRGSVAEIGSLAKINDASPRAPLAIFREMFAFVRDHNIRYLTAGLEPKLYPGYQRLFGAALRRLNPEDELVVFPGVIGGQVPLLVEVEHAYRQFQETKHQGSLRERLAKHIVEEYFANRIDLAN